MVTTTDGRGALGIPDLLTFNGGYVDTAGFLALHGLFSAHVTGNFPTLLASLVEGSSGAVAKLLALPVFCLVILLVQLLSQKATSGALPTLLGLKTALLAAAAIVALAAGPFTNGDTVVAIVTGMLLVAAMAIQNAVHRLHFSASPPTTVMTGTTTQAMIDIADLIRGDMTLELRAATRARARKLGHSMGVFALGCALAALAYAAASMWVFIPPVLAGFVSFLYFYRLRSPVATQA
jgi:uncharacterized membrane protein YoaK (UPF0700 family)